VKIPQNLSLSESRLALRMNKFSHLTRVNEGAESTPNLCLGAGNVPLNMCIKNAHICDTPCSSLGVLRDFPLEAKCAYEVLRSFSGSKMKRFEFYHVEKYTPVPPPHQRDKSSLNMGSNLYSEHP
jgi:hypothetical protein